MINNWAIEKKIALSFSLCDTPHINEFELGE